MGAEAGKDNQRPKSDKRSAQQQGAKEAAEAASGSAAKTNAASFAWVLIAWVGVIFVLAFDWSWLLWGVFLLVTAILVRVSEYNWWPWIGLLLLALFVLYGLPDFGSAAPQATPTMGPTRLVPVPSSKLQLGTGLLVPDQVLDLTVIVPVEGQQPQRYVFHNVRVDQLLGENGPVSIFQRSDIKTIVLALPEDMGEELQSVLALGTSTIAYSLVPTSIAAAQQTTNTPAPAAMQEGTQTTVTASPAKVYVTIPIDESTSGTGPLAVGDFLELFVYALANDGTPMPTPSSFLSLTVAGLSSDAGPVSTTNWNAVKEITVEVSQEEASLLQAALSRDNVRIIYHKMASLPTATQMPTEGTPSPPPTPQWTELSILRASIPNLDASLEAGEKGRLVIVRASPDATSGTSMPGGAPDAQEFCVIVTALPTEGSISFQLELRDLARYAESITAPVNIFLVSDDSCSIP